MCQHGLGFSQHVGVLSEGSQFRFHFDWLRMRGFGSWNLAKVDSVPDFPQVPEKHRIIGLLL